MIGFDQLLWIFGATLQAVAALTGLVIVIYVFWYDKVRSNFREESLHMRNRALGKEMISFGATEITLFFRKRGKKPEVKVDIHKPRIPEWKRTLIEAGGVPAAPPDPTDAILGGFAELATDVVRHAQRGLAVVVALGIGASTEAAIGLVVATSEYGTALAFLLLLTFEAMLVSIAWFVWTYIAEGQVDWIYRGTTGGLTRIVSSDRF